MGFGCLDHPMEVLRVSVTAFECFGTWDYGKPTLCRGIQGDSTSLSGNPCPVACATARVSPLGIPLKDSFRTRFFSGRRVPHSFMGVDGWFGFRPLLCM